MKFRHKIENILSKYVSPMQLREQCIIEIDKLYRREITKLIKEAEEAGDQYGTLYELIRRELRAKIEKERK